MISYVDTSVLLRLELMEPETLAEWSELTEGVTSQIGIVECHRGLFQALAMKRLSDASLPAAQKAIEVMLDRLRIVRCSDRGRLTAIACHPRRT